MVQIAEGQSQLKALEDKILSLLASSGDDILEDEVLINTLAQSKKTSEEINKDLEVAERTSKEIDEAREGYRIVATRGSLIYSVIASIGGLQHMYQVWTGQGHGCCRCRRRCYWCRGRYCCCCCQRFSFCWSNYCRRPRVIVMVVGGMILCSP